MSNTTLQRDLISHCIQFMSNKNVVIPLLRNHGIQVCGSSYLQLVEAYETDPDALTVDEICSAFRNHWIPCDIEYHIHNLQSGLLTGHSWHKAQPSFLHRSLQTLVRKCCSNGDSLEEYLEMGTDIIRHEYFMVAIHDICETSIIRSFPSVIPPIRTKSITDFVFDGAPYDLKVTTHKEPWKPFAGQMNLEQKKQLAIALVMEADSERLRADADKCRNNWGLNRMYYVVNDQDKWLNDPRGTVQYLLDNICDAGNFFDIAVQGVHIHICMIEQ